MSLKEKINNDLREAMKAQDIILTETLRSIRAEILKMDKSGMNREMTHEEEIQLLNKQVKMRKEAIEMFEKAGRTDLVDREKKQLEIILKYLPEQISTSEAEAVIDKIISGFQDVTAKDFGKIMGLAMKELKGKIDGKIVQEIVKSKLQPPQS
ncbi:MAG: GatB/YqeY domain-containing protein [Ignavibacteria bacterium]|nr:GatB/YqeY domain-containing protein [Ignavibacteria bacterium]